MSVEKINLSIEEIKEVFNTFRPECCSITLHSENSSYYMSMDKFIDTLKMKSDQLS
jgi:hypothetical protein